MASGTCDSDWSIHGHDGSDTTAVNEQTQISGENEPVNITPKHGNLDDMNNSSSCKVDDDNSKMAPGKDDKDNVMVVTNQPSSVLKEGSGIHTEDNKPGTGNGRECKVSELEFSATRDVPNKEMDKNHEEKNMDINTGVEKKDKEIQSKTQQSTNSDVQTGDNKSDDEQRKAALTKIRQYNTNDDDYESDTNKECEDGKQHMKMGKEEEYLNTDDKPYYKRKHEAFEKYEYFWKTNDIYSQWHPSCFSVQDMTFRNAEQFMMYKKAKLFGDDRVAKKILKADTPREIKSLGRKVKPFHEDTWNFHKLHVVKEGNMAKFSQNKELKSQLFNTYSKVLVEASPYDTVWGIGLAKNDPCAWSKETWCGENLLGYIITEVRDELMADEGIIENEHKQVYLDKLIKGCGTSVDEAIGKDMQDTVAMSVDLVTENEACSRNSSEPDVKPELETKPESRTDPGLGTNLHTENESANRNQPREEPRIKPEPETILFTEEGSTDKNQPRKKTEQKQKEKAAPLDEEWHEVKSKRGKQVNSKKGKLMSKK